MSAANYLEAAIVVDSARDPVASRRFDQLIEAAGPTLVDVTRGDRQSAPGVPIATSPKGSGHRARLNLGDAYAYALASEDDDDLLFTGDDFQRIDVPVAVPSVD